MTPKGAYHLLIHFDVPDLDPATHAVTFGAGFDAPFSLAMDDIRALAQHGAPVRLIVPG